MNDTASFDFINFKPDCLSTEDFIKVGLPAFLPDPGSLSSTENYFHPQSGIYGESFRYILGQDNFIVAKLSIDGTPISNEKFHEGSFRGVLGIWQDYKDTTVNGYPGMIEEITTVTPGPKNIITVNVFANGILLNYNVGFRTEVPEDIGQRVKALGAIVLS